MNFHELLNFFEDSSWRVLLMAGIAVVLALVLHRLGSVLLRHLTRDTPIMGAVVHQILRPTRFVLPLLALQLVWAAAPDDFALITQVRHATALILLASLTWLVSRAVDGVAQGIIAQNPFELENNRDARRIQTQTRLLKRTANFMVFMAGLSLMLMTFPGARNLGASLLASAGVIGIVVGIAARPVFSNLIAGLQLALAQPIRLGDVLVVKDEWGRVEEITGTYVVLNIWDERRLIIPLQWFIENPFQNWTRSSADITGSVFLWVDYRMPLEPLRQAANDCCAAAPEWDKRLCLLQVVEAGERSIKLRVLVTSVNSSLNWDLRCKVRETLVDFMQRHYPQHLPLMRAELGPSEAGPSPRPTA
jgi:small-conductance mechanosensitive channel